MNPVRLASIGLGRWARVLARGAQRGSVIELVNCFSRREETRAAFQGEFGILRSASSLDELLSDPEVEGVLVTTPNDTHKSVILESIDAGKAVYTDKPIAHTMEDAGQIAAAAKAAGVGLAVGHSARRLAGHRLMRRWIDDGRVGRVSLAEANFSNERGLELTTDTWRFFADKSPGGALIQLGVHHADTLQYLLGPVAAVTSVARRLYTPAEVPDAVMTILEFEAGPLGYIGTGWASPAVYQLRLLGTEANLLYDLDVTHWSESHVVDEFSTLVSQAYHQSERPRVELPATDMFREQLEEFALAIRGEADIEVGADEAIRALAVVHAALESSARNGQAVAVVPMLEAAGMATATATASGGRA
ncbi:MAG: Gfo/Idh/MocA family protein [Acidimicrobiales bacterium]